MDRTTSPFGVNTYSYTLIESAQACVSRLADRGYGEFELMMYPGHLWPADTDAAARRKLRGLFEARGLKLVTLNMPNVDLNIAGAAKEMRDYTLGLLTDVVQLAGDLGAAGVIIGPGKYNPLFPAPKQRLVGYFHEALDRLLPLAERAGTELWVENMPFAFLPDIDSLLAALDEYGSDRIGIVYDVANGHFIAEDLGEALRKCRPRLRLVHLSDTGRNVYKHDPVGQGDVPFAEVPAALAGIGYHKRTMLEVISHDPDREIDDSAARLLGMGWGGPQ